MPGIFDLIYGPEGAARAEAEARANAIHGKNALGMLGSILGGPYAGMGKEFMDAGQSGEKDLNSGLSARGRVGEEALFKALQLQAMRSQSAQDLAGTKAAARQVLQEMINEGAQKRVETQGGTARDVARTNAGSRVKAAEIGAGAKLGAAQIGAEAKAEAPPKLKAFAPGEADKLTGLKGDLEALDSLYGEFRPEYAGKGLLGNLQLSASQLAGSSAPEKQQRLANFWSRFQQLVEIPQRHKMFGSALSKTEAAIWDKARTLSPKSDPAVVADTFQRMREIGSNKLTSIAHGRAAEGFAPEAIKQYTGVEVAPATAAPAAASADDELINTYLRKK